VLIAREGFKRELQEALVLLSSSLAAPGAIPPLHFNDRIDQFFRRPFGTRPTDSVGGKQQRYFCLVKSL
jgi:hypothetical protein